MEGLFGFVIVIIIIFVIVKAVSNSNSKDSDKKTSTRTRSKSTKRKTNTSRSNSSSGSRRVKEDLSKTTFRVIDKPIQFDDGTEFEALHFQMKGPIPVPSKMSCSNCDKYYTYESKYCTSCGSNVGITIAVSIFDDEKKMPFVCHIDVFQEKNSRAFLSLFEIGNTRKGDFYRQWTTVGHAVKESLVPPRSGITKLRMFYRFIETGIESQISGGWIDEENIKQVYSSVMYPETKVSKTIIDLVEEGYLDLGDNSKIAHKQALTLGVELALIDGEMHDLEGTVINEWVRKYVESFSGEEKVKMKNEMNATMRRSYKDSISKAIDKEETIKELLAVGKKADFGETMELLVDIMAADKEAHKDELDFIKRVGDLLGVSSTDIQKMKDLRFINEEGLDISQNNPNEILGIDPGKMTKVEICKHLGSEFNKWNSRLHSINDPEKRQKTQTMVDLITEARIKYCE